MTRFSFSAIFFSLFVLTGFSLACAANKNTQKDTNESQQHKEEQEAAEIACEKDADCVLVPADCCGCRQGGKQRAVHKKFLESNAKKRRESCGSTFCIQMISKDPSCKATRAQCQKNKCTLRE